MVEKSKLCYKVLPLETPSKMPSKRLRTENVTSKIFNPFMWIVCCTRIPRE